LGIANASTRGDSLNKPDGAIDYLNRASDLYHSLIDEGGESEDSIGLARTHIALSDVAQVQEQPAVERQHLESAIAALSSLERVPDQDHQDYLRWSKTANTDLSEWHVRHGRMEDAELYSRAALDIILKMAKNSPTASNRRAESVSRLDHAEVLLQRGDLDAFMEYEKAIDIRRELLEEAMKEGTESDREHRDLAMALCEMSRASFLTGDWARGIEHGNQARELFMNLVQGDHRNQVSAAYALTWLGLSQAGAGDAEAALRTLRQAAELGGQALDGAPGMTSYRVYCARAQAAYGEVLIASGRPDEAIEHLSSAIEIVQEGAAPGGGYISVPTVALMVEIRTNLGQALMHGDTAQPADHLHAAARDMEKLKALGRERSVRTECRERLGYLLAEAAKGGQ
ncbi:MAG: tetratricopeptide repeat protein, partial [Phycisphaerales bacterium]|nr:tetratricopeptide repeat protein [Phycisphaerales bacterium]